MSEKQCCATPLRDLCESALKHYEKLSSDACDYNSLIPKAIKFYQENYGRYFLKENEKAEWKSNPDIVMCMGCGNLIKNCTCSWLERGGRPKYTECSSLSEKGTVKP
jgi:hypothetical protein